MLDFRKVEDIDRLKYNLHLRSENKAASKFEWKNPEEADGIPIFARGKVSMSDPNIRATFNNFAVIMNKKAGYLAGHIERKYSDDIQDEVKAKYKEFDRLNNCESLYTELMASCTGWGNTYSLCYIDKPDNIELKEQERGNYPVRVKEVQAWNAKIEYDDNGEPVEGTVYYDDDEKRKHVFEYDKLYVREWLASKSGNSYELVSEQRHGFTEIPLVEWKNNKLGRGNSQNAVTLMDAYDRLMSDNITEWATFRQAYLLLKGLGLVDEETTARMQKTGILTSATETGEARFITKDVNPEFVKFITEKTWRSIWIVACSIDPEATASLTNATAFQIMQMYALMDDDCKFTEQCWMRSFEYLDRILKSYWTGLDINSVNDYSTYDIDYNFIKEKPQDIMTFLKDLRAAGGTLPNAEILKRSGYDEQTAEELAQRAAEEGYDAIPNLG